VKINIIADNYSGYGSPKVINDFQLVTGSSIVDNGYNIVEVSTNYTWGATNITGQQANLNIATDLEGDMPQTFKLLLNSVAINAGGIGTNGSVSVPTTDQRGFTRDATPDIGAFESIIPGITTQPQSVSVCNATSTSFSIVATGDETITYRWQISSNGTDFSNLSNGGVYTGVLTNNLSISNVTGLHEKYYRCVATNPAGSTNSASAILNIKTTTNITTHPSNQNVCPNSAATFTVVAEGENLTYQWKKGTEAISGAVSATYTISSANSGHIGNYSCVVTGDCGVVTSSVVALSLKTVTSITTQPLGVTKCPGDSHTFSVVAEGENLQYQWQHFPVNQWNNIGENSSSLTISNISSANAGSYRVVITGDCGTVNSNSVSLIVYQTTSIFGHPGNTWKCIGGSHTFTVSASGTNLSYQWKKGTTDVGTNSNQLTIENIQETDVDSYSCVVTGTCGTATSNSATLSIFPNPEITLQPESKVVCQGTFVQFTVTATNATSYQWKRGATVVGGNSATLSISNAQSSDEGEYTCTVTGTCTSVTSEIATLTVNQTTAISTQPESQTACAGSNVSFNVTAIGAGLSYQWQKNSVNILDATSSTYTINNVQAGDAANYRCWVLGTCGNAVSQTVTLTITDQLTINPLDAQTACEGNNISFTVYANGTNPTYQWQKDGVNLSNGSGISGVNSSSLLFENVNISHQGNYSCYVPSDCGNGESNQALLTVYPAIQLTTDLLETYEVCDNSELILEVQATGTDLFYTWYFNGSEITDENSNTLTITNVTVDDAGQYYCVVSGPACGNVESTYADVTVFAQPVGGVISGNNEISYGDPTGTLELSDYTGNVVHWERKINTQEWEIIPGTETTFSETPENIGVYKYKVLIENGVCDPVYSNEFEITVNAREITISGLVVENKVYNGTNAATVDSWGHLENTLVEDDIYLDYSNAFVTFPSVNAGLDYELIISGLTINGDDASNYSLILPVITADILQKPLTVTARSFYKTLGVEYIFDGDEFFAGEMISGDVVTSVTLYSDGAQSDAFEGEYDIVPSDAAGIGIGNYDIDYVNGIMYVVDKAELFLNGLLVADKAYDGTNIASIADWETLSPVADGDDVELDITNVVALFSNKNAANNKPVSITGLALSGADADKYYINNHNSTADINKRTLVLSNFTANDKEYDGTTTVAGTGFDDDRINGDIIVLTFAAAFENKNVGQAKTVNYFDITISSGADANNYALISTTATATANITAKELTIGGTFTVLDKEYDGTTAATIEDNNLTLITAISGDDVEISSIVAEFEDSEVGEDKIVSIVSALLLGDDKDNYTLSLIGVPTTTASITSPPIVEYTLTITIVGNGTVEVDGEVYSTAITVEEGTVFDLEAIADSGWEFDSWSGDVANVLQSITTITMNSDKNITATFTEEVSVINSGTYDITLYPNPTKGNFNIISEEIITEVRIFDITGKLIFSQQHDSKVLDIKLSDVEPGMYFVRITTQGGEKIMKLQMAK